MCANPFFLGLGTSDWTGDGYRLREPYADGAEVEFADEGWIAPSTEAPIPPPKEYRHALGKLIGELAELGFMVYALEESTHGRPEAEPGSWEHFTSFAPPWIRFWCLLRPDVLPVG
jgi:hypothetical protein